MLEDKITRYFFDNNIDHKLDNVDLIAKDIAEIAENEYLNVMSEQNTVMKKLEKENAELKADNIRLKDEVNKLDEGIHHHKDPHFKMFIEIQEDLEAKLITRNGRILELEQQLVAIKYLNREEVEKIIEKFRHAIYEHYRHNLDAVDVIGAEEKVITAICNLAIPVIDKDRIIRILTKHLKPEDSDEQYFEHLAIGEIANEILNDKSDKDN